MITQGRLPASVLDQHVEPFINHLQAAAYADRTLRKKRIVARAFSQWMTRKRVAIEYLSDEHIAAFIARSPRNCREHMRAERAAMRLFFQYLRAAGVLQAPAQPQKEPRTKQ